MSKAADHVGESNGLQARIMPGSFAAITFSYQSVVRGRAIRC